MQVNHMSRDDAKAILGRFKAAMEREFGAGAFEIVGSSAINGSSFTMKVAVYNNGPEDKVAMDKAKWATYCDTWGFTVEDFGRRFVNKGQTFQIVGINPSKPKFCIQAQCLDDGEVYGFPEEVKARLAPLAPASSPSTRRRIPKDA